MVEQPARCAAVIRSSRSFEIPRCYAFQPLKRPDLLGHDPFVPPLLRKGRVQRFFLKPYGENIFTDLPIQIGFHLLHHLERLDQYSAPLVVLVKGIHLGLTQAIPGWGRPADRNKQGKPCAIMYAAPLPVPPIMGDYVDIPLVSGSGMEDHFVAFIFVGACGTPKNVVCLEKGLQSNTEFAGRPKPEGHPFNRA